MRSWPGWIASPTSSNRASAQLDPGAGRRAHERRGPADRADRRGRAGACTPRAAATIRSRPICGCTRGAAALELVSAIDEARARAVPARARARRHAAARLHAPAARAGGHAGAPPAGVRRDAGARSRPPAGRRTARRANRRWARARWPGPACRSIARRPPPALGFAGGPTHNSLDAVSDRDFAVEIAFACALMGVHLSRLGEELVLWSTTEFGFVRLGEGYCSGSSLMPQKRNPDIAELLRGKPGRAVGDVVALLTIGKGLPLAYNKDLQETQEPLYDAVETARQSLAVLPGLIDDAGVRRRAHARRRRRSRAGGDRPRGGDGPRRHAVPQRARAGGARWCAPPKTKGVSLRELSAADLAAIDASLTPAILAALDPARAVAARALVGGPAPGSGRARGRAAGSRAARRRPRAVNARRAGARALRPRRRG